MDIGHVQSDGLQHMVDGRSVLRPPCPDWLLLPPKCHSCRPGISSRQRQGDGTSARYQTHNADLAQHGPLKSSGRENLER